eukprot:347483-Prymnesium_polylepis.1
MRISGSVRCPPAAAPAPASQNKMSVFSHPTPSRRFGRRGPLTHGNESAAELSLATRDLYAT